MRKVILVISILALVILSAPAQETSDPKAESAQAEKPAEMPPTPLPLTGEARFEGNIINTGGSLFLGGFFSVSIDTWTSEKEAAELRTILENEGQKALLKKVWDMKQVGYLKVGSSMGKPIRAARAIPVPGGYVVRLLTDTPVAHAGNSSRDYPFGVVEMVIPVDGTKGHGNLVAMAQFSFDEAGTLQVSAYGTMPVRLEEIVMKKT